MVLGVGTFFTVIAENQGNPVLILGRHCVLREHRVDAVKVFGHVGERFETCGTLVGCLNVLFVTFVMDTMTTWHKDDGGGRGEHVLATNGTVALQVAFDALVFSLKGNGHANITSLAVEKVLSQTASDSTNTAVFAVVNGLSRIIVPQFTLVAIIMGQGMLALFAGLSRRCNVETMHAHHPLGLMSIHRMISRFIVTKSARYPFPTTIGLKFGFPLVMLTSQLRCFCV